MIFLARLGLIEASLLASFNREFEYFLRELSLLLEEAAGSSSERLSASYPVAQLIVNSILFALLSENETPLEPLEYQIEIILKGAMVGDLTGGIENTY